MRFWAGGDTTVYRSTGRAGGSGDWVCDWRRPAGVVTNGDCVGGVGGPQAGRLYCSVGAGMESARGAIGAPSYGWHRMLEHSPHEPRSMRAAKGWCLPAGRDWATARVGHINMARGRVRGKSRRLSTRRRRRDVATKPALRSRCIAHVKERAAETPARMLRLGSPHRSRTQYRSIISEALIDACTLAGDRQLQRSTRFSTDATHRRAARKSISIASKPIRHTPQPRTLHQHLRPATYAMRPRQTLGPREKAYVMLSGGDAHREATASDALAAAYVRAENDEFVLPTVVGEAQTRRGRRCGDLLQLPSRRGRELTLAFCDAHFSHLRVSMTRT